MRKVGLGSVLVLFVLAFVPSLVAQDAQSPAALPAVDPNSAAPASATPASTPSDTSVPATTAPATAPARSFNDVLDHVVQREHLFMAQMRHMHPMVETYLQDLKKDSEGNDQPVKDQYYLGRLDMTDGPEDTSFVGQPGFGHRMLTK